MTAPCPALLVLFLIGLVGALPARADCIDDAARHHQVNAQVLRAIGWHESRLRPGAVGHNRNGTRDLGAFQINTTHLAELGRHGITAAHLHDGCTSAFVAGWHYARQVARFGNTWRAVGAYHSHTEARSAWYANAIAAVLAKWHVLPPGVLPYAPHATLAPTAAAPSGPQVPAGPLFDDGTPTAP